MWKCCILQYLNYVREREISQFSTKQHTRDLESFGIAKLGLVIVIVLNVVQTFRF